jgi:hypothetical protein
MRRTERLDFKSYLGNHLKDDIVVEILELYEMEVIYDFDRLHEGIEDQYWAKALENGFLFRFDENQRLDVIFFYMRPREGYAPIARTSIDVPIYETFDEAHSACVAQALRCKTSAGAPGTKLYQRWIRFEFDEYTAHYQFDAGQLDGITLMVPGLP